MCGGGVSWVGWCGLFVHILPRGKLYGVFELAATYRVPSPHTLPIVGLLLPEFIGHSTLGCLQKQSRLKQKMYRAQCIPFVTNINYLKGIFAQISASLCASVIEFF